MTEVPSHRTSPTTTADKNWWRGAVIYQIYPRSYADYNGDGIGDLAGIVEKLPHIAKLGADAIWISPFFRSPMKDFGYDVSDYRDVDPMFGTLADFDRLVARAHELGLKVMIDQVLSHTSDQHAWFIESRSSRDNPRADWYVWVDPQPDGSPPNNWLSVFGGSSWQWDTRRKQYYLHNFLVSQPDLNFHNEAVQQQLLDDIRFWLDRGVDGFRFDACNFHFHDRQLRSNPAQALAAGQELPANPYEMQVHQFDKTQPENLAFLERIRRLLDEYGAASVGEIGDPQALPTMLAYSAQDKRLNMTYSFSLLTPEKSAAYIRRQVEEFETMTAQPGNGGWPCWTISNHDMPRMMSRWGGADAPLPFARVAGAMLLSLRGSACWYQGDELGLPEAEVPYELLQDPVGITFWPANKGRDGCRTPMPWQRDQPHGGFGTPADKTPWLPVPEAHRARAVDVSEADPDAPIHFLRAFLQWRKTVPALRTGHIRFLDAPEPVLALVRSPETGDGGPSLLMLFNLAGHPCSFELPDAPASTFSNAGPFTHLPATQRGQRQGARFDMPAHGLYVGAIAGA
jgi:alpha-glucosidase